MHLDVSVIGKGAKGRTACGSSAYRACESIQDNVGNVHDYTHKGGHAAGGVELPEGAPAELLDRQTLWSRHDLKEKRKDAEIFREVTLALPNALDHSACERILRRLATKLTEKGMCVQWDVHDVTQNGQRNLHAHMMVTLRELLSDGTFGNKNRSWNKYNGGLNIAEILRPEAARLMNEELEKIGITERVEHESYAARGIDKLPQKHIGVAATAMERKGVKTNKGRWNRYIEALNEMHVENLREAEAKLGGLDAVIAGAMAQKDGNEIYRDWDALFAALRDVRRSKAACRTEIRKLEKIISAYEEPTEQNTSYLRWAGCDPEDELQKEELKTMKNDLQMQIAQMDISEELLLDSKELLKAHNKVKYASKKVAWDEYQMMRNKRTIEYQTQRYWRLDSYITNIKNSMSFWDVLFDTKKYQTLKSMQASQKEIQRKNKERLQAIKQGRKDLKQHQKDVRSAEREEKRTERQYRREHR